MLQHQPPVYTIGQENLVFIVLDEDPITHTNEHPFCDDPECDCHEDSTLVRMFITVPLNQGLMSNSEAIRLYFGTQLVPTQDERIIDEEIAEVMATPSPLDRDIEENYHRPPRISAQFQGMMDSLLLEHD